MHRDKRIWPQLRRVWGWGTLLKEHKEKLKLFLLSLSSPYSLPSSESPTIPLCSAVALSSASSLSAVLIGSLLSRLLGLETLSAAELALLLQAFWKEP